MIKNWLNPSLSLETNLKGRVADIVKTSHGNLEESTRNIFLIADKSDFAEKTKKAFFRLQNHFNDLCIYDLGILKNENPEFVIALLRELIPLKGRILLLSDNLSYLDSAFRALEYANKHVSLACIDSSIDKVLEERTSRSLKSKNLLNLSVIGYQRHFCPPEVLTFLHESFVHHLSLGQSKNEISKIEPILRNCNVASIDMAALKLNNAMPNGFDALEICQIAKYAGMSSSLQIMNISNSIGWDASEIAPISGQMLWYFTEGQVLKELDPKSNNAEYFLEHLVQTDYSNYSFTFWKSSKTNRWWFEIPNSEGERGNIYPCNKEDYDLACRNEISEYLLNQINLDH